MTTFTLILFVVGLFQLTMGYSFHIGDEMFEYQIPSLLDARQDENETAVEATIWPNPCGPANTCPLETLCGDDGLCSCMEHSDCPLEWCIKNPETPEAPGICAGMQCSLFIDANGDAMIDEKEISEDIKLHLMEANNGSLPVHATDDYLQRVAKGVMYDFDRDQDQLLSVLECINIFKPVDHTARAEKDCKTEDVDKDGMVNAKEIIEYSEKVGSFPWMCCKPTDDCASDDSKSLEVCQKEAFQYWIENEHFPLVTNATAPVESFTIDDCVAGAMIMMQPNMIPCGGEACEEPTTDSSSEELTGDSNETSDEAPTDSLSAEQIEASTEAPADDPVVAP